MVWRVASGYNKKIISCLFTLTPHYRFSVLNITFYNGCARLNHAFEKMCYRKIGFSPIGEFKQ